MYKRQGLDLALGNIDIDRTGLDIEVLDGQIAFAVHARKLDDRFPRVERGGGIGGGHAVAGVAADSAGVADLRAEMCIRDRAYTLQRINRVAFRHPEELIENIDAVSRFIDRKQIGLECIRLCRAKDGRKYCIDDQGEFWRAYNFISGGISLDMPRDRNDFYQAAVAFGKFQQALADFPAASLYETCLLYTSRCV